MKINRTSIIITAVIIVLITSMGVMQLLFPPEVLKTDIINNVTIPYLEEYLATSTEEDGILHGASSAPCANTKVTDIKNHPFENEINALLINCLVSGYSDATFRPQDPINRAELTKIVIGAFFTAEELATAISFYQRQGLSVAGLPDVLLSEWYAPYVALGLLEEIINGYKGETVTLNGVQGPPFKPSNAVSFAEAFKILYNAKLAVSDNDTRNTLQNELFYSANDISSLPSVSRDDWTRPYMIAGTRLGIYPTEYVSLRNSPISRGTFAYLAVNVISY
jgi:hypothetical protein